MHQGKTVSGVNRRGLSTVSANNDQQRLIPLNNRIGPCYGRDALRILAIGRLGMNQDRVSGRGLDCGQFRAPAAPERQLALL